jgi:hypothetical protein
MRKQCDSALNYVSDFTIRIRDVEEENVRTTKRVVDLQASFKHMEQALTEYVKEA